MNFLNIIKGKPILLIISVIIFYVFILLLSDIEKISQQFNKIYYLYYLVIFPLVMLAIVMGAYRYHIMLKKLDINLSFKDGLVIFYAGLSMLITPGGAGALIKSHIIKQKIGKSFSSTTPIVIYEKWLEFLSTVIMVGILLFWVNFLEAKVVFVVGLIFSSFTFIIFKNSIGLQFLNKLILKTKIFQKLSVDNNEFQKATGKLLAPITFTKLFSISLLNRIILLVIVFLIFKSCGLSFDLFLTGQLYFTSIIIGTLSFIPGGFVVTEAGLLGLILKNGADISIASVLVIVIRLVTTWFPTILGFVAIKILSHKNLRTNEV